MWAVCTGCSLLPSTESERLHTEICNHHLSVLSSCIDYRSIIFDCQLRKSLKPSPHQGVPPKNELTYFRIWGLASISWSIPMLSHTYSETWSKHGIMCAMVKTCTWGVVISPSLGIPHDGHINSTHRRMAISFMEKNNMFWLWHVSNHQPFFGLWLLI